MKRVFLVAPTHMNLYQDIVDELEKQKYEVEFLALKVFPNDPFFVFVEKNKKYDKEAFLKRLENYWVELYNSGTYSFDCDYLIVINGSAVHPVLFSLIKRKNPDVKCINYLFDSTQNTYRFDRNFKYYDRIFTFDQKDAAKYNLNFLAIYWTPIEKKKDINVSIFGMGVYNKERFRVFSEVKRIADKLQLSSFIHLFYPKESIIKVRLRSYISKLFNKSGGISINEYTSNLIIHESLSLDIFRQYIINSDIILDTSNPGQDGLTARFMWALGAGKKIITNNKSVISYTFYNIDQFYVLGIDPEDKLESFLKSRSIERNETLTNIVLKWRIDNWVKTLLNKF